MDNHLATMLQVAVPLHIHELKAKGGPSDADLKAATAFGQVLAETGDVLIFGSRKPGETADLFNRTARAIAVLAFCPGGVRLFGCHFEAK
jgi:hypothetical protein